MFGGRNKHFSPVLKIEYYFHYSSEDESDCGRSSSIHRNVTFFGAAPPVPTCKVFRFR